MTMFMQHGDNFIPTPGRDSVLDELPVGNFVVEPTLTGLQYKRVAPFGPEGPSYGNLDTRADRIMRTFLDRERTTGVLLAGEKGSGKTRLARQLSRLGYDLGMPTVLVNAPFHGDQFSELLAAIEGSAIVLCDEFEKTYREKEAQEAMLTLLDGTMTTNKLFILTVNDRWAVSDHMKNRPGRLYYNLEFDGLGVDFIRDYCQDRLEDKSQIDAVVQASALFLKFNFDMLKALVEEMNRYKETPFEALELLNAKPVDVSYGDRYEVTGMSKEGIRGTVDNPVNQTPLTSRGEAMHVAFRITKADQPEDIPAKARTYLDQLLAEVEDSEHYIHVAVHARDVTRIDADAGRYEFRTKEGHTIRFTRLEREQRDLQHLAW